MAETTNIEWADATLNFWVGCTKVSVGEKGACHFCYAETWAKRWPLYQNTWGVGAPRVKFAHLQSKARKLEKLAIAKAARGEGAFFCFSNSLSDIFDNEVPIKWLVEAIDIARSTPHVTYLFLTKRPQNIVKRFKAAMQLGEDLPVSVHDLASLWPKNIAIGCTVVTQAEADRDLPALKRAHDLLKPAFAFVSMEPLMEIVDMTEHLFQLFLAWVITGGESGTHARITPVEAFRSLRDQCARAGVPFLHKQNGEWMAEGQVAAEPIEDTSRTENRIVGGVRYWRVGKKLAGRRLDNAEHSARPAPRQLEAA